MMQETTAITFTLNGQTVQAQSGETALQVARRQEIDIPTLCHHDSVAPYGGCRLCLVEVRWGKRAKLVTACLYQPEANDAIETNSERVRQARRMVLELLLTRNPGVEIIQRLAAEYGVEQVRYRTAPSAAGLERCILCGLCVRVCDEVVGQQAIAYAQRGSAREITTPFGEQSAECIGCGACVFVCPTGALNYQDVDGQRVLDALHTRVPLVACRECGSHFATAPQLARVQEWLNLPEEMLDICPRCRGIEFREVMDHCLVGKTRG